MGPLPKKIRTAVSNLARAVRFVWDSSPGLTLANSLLVIIQGILPVISLYVMKLVIDSITGVLTAETHTGDFRTIGLLIALEAVIALCIAAVSTLAKWISAVHGERVTDYMYELTHAKSLDVDLEYYETSSYYDTLYRAQSEAPHRPSQILSNVLGLGRSFIGACALAGLLFLYHWWLSIVLIAAIVPGIIVKTMYAKEMYRWTKSRTPAERKTWYFHRLLVSSSTAKEIRLFDLGKLFMDRFNGARKKLRDERRSMMTRQSVKEFLVQASTTVVIFSVYGFLAFQAFQRTISLGDFFVCYRAFQRGQSMLREFFAKLADLYEDHLYLSDLFGFFSLKRKVREHPRPVTFPRPLQSGIVFENVTFAYPSRSERIVLHEINLNIRPGETVAFVGDNGSGKTTLIKLLCRLYDPLSGVIKFDGVDARMFRTDDLRRQFSVIFQDFMCYQMSARENIGLGHSAACNELEKIKQAAERAGAARAIERLKQGYHTTLGSMFEDGALLSYGEWQKIALARAFLREAPILILDEPTSSMDAQTEYEIFNRMRNSVNGADITVLISHRFSTVRMADTIYVLDSGRLIEGGSHDELMAWGGKYAEMFTMQASAYQKVLQ